jgi:hypothetical protein
MHIPGLVLENWTSECWSTRIQNGKGEGKTQSSAHQELLHGFSQALALKQPKPYEATVELAGQPQLGLWILVQVLVLIQQALQNAGQDDRLAFIALGVEELRALQQLIHRDLPLVQLNNTNV